MLFKDYSLNKRGKTTPRPIKPTAFQSKSIAEADAKKSKLQSLDVDIEMPLSTCDWNQFAMIIAETQGFGWVQLLPEKQKSSMPLQFNTMHVMPSFKIPFNKVPLDFMISNKLNFIKKNEKAKKNGNASNF